MGTSKTILDNGKLIRVNSREERIKYKNYKNIQKEEDKIKVDKGSNKYERYRIPEKLIKEFLILCK